MNLPEICFLFSYFTGNGEDGLHLAWSIDGLKWEALRGGRSFLPPHVGDKIMRDPSLLLGPDAIFRLTWTDSWTSRSIGYASSPDLLDWSEQQSLPLMEHEAQARNCWAPEVHYDALQKNYLIIWSTTITGQFPETETTTEENYNHRIYATTTTDFISYTPERLFFDPGFCCIDATIIATGEEYVLVFKNETLYPTPQKNLWLARSPCMAGPYTNITGPLPTDPPNWVEGPTSLRIGSEFFIYYDCYQGGRFGAISSSDFKNWTNLSLQLAMPSGIRHGTVLAVPSEIIWHLQSGPA